ncbi:hypothetical protein OPV22_002417 [Ensete ventricosum]|uniref:Ribosomal RNA-processing protein 14/surfeit locus protein 6 C-terminal domain-containing protein n=1 Tax=Ensete ventricosum TaxID=4639 RepID=A0AAV8RXR4_ENSVE|nr:hypothetical protein OPV22_002417 [Ensete ventricosum]
MSSSEIDDEAKSGRRRPAAATDSGVDLKDLIHGHSVFFDRFDAKATAKAESRVNLREFRRARLVPAKSSTTTLDLLNKSIDAEKIATDTSEEADNGDEDEDDGENETEVDNPCPVICDDRSVTYEELRSGRNTRPLFDKHNKKKKKHNKKKNVERDASASQGKRKINEKETGEETKEKMAKTRGDVIALDISFGQVKVGRHDENRRKRRKLSKQQELEEGEKAGGVKEGPREGAEGIRKIFLEGVCQQSCGHEEKIRAEKQKTRAENMKERINQKKMRRIEKREKKLMRPRRGFEGQKEGYVNE